MRMRPPTWPCARFSPGEHVTEVAGVHIHRLTLSQGRTPEGIWNSRAALVPIVDDHHGNADRADHERINGWGRGRRRLAAPAAVGYPAAAGAPASATVTAGGSVRLLCTVQCEATASSPPRRSAGTPSGTWMSSRMSVTRAGRDPMVYSAVRANPAVGSACRIR